MCIIICSQKYIETRVLDILDQVIFILFTPSKQIVMTFLNKLAEEKFVKSRKAWDFGV